MLTAQQQQSCELWCNAELLKGKRTSESNEALEARSAMLEAKTDNSSDESLLAEESQNY